MSEIDQINKLIKIKSNKIEEIKSSKNYINKYINEKHFSSKTEEDYQYRIKMLNKLKNDYIKILRLIESNKKLINRNEEEIRNLKETKNNLMELNYRLDNNQEQNEKNKEKLKNLREKLETLTKSENECKIIYENAINQLNIEIINKKKKIEECKYELDKETQDDGQTKQKIKQLYDEMKNKQKNILINNDYFKPTKKESKKNIIKANNDDKIIKSNENIINTNLKIINDKKDDKNNDDNILKKENNEKNMNIIKEIPKEEKKVNEKKDEFINEKKRPKFTISPFKSEDIKSKQKDLEKEKEK